MSDSLASLAVEMKGSEVQSQIAVAVLKQMQQQQQQQAAMLVKMINQAPSFDGTGKVVNIGV